MSHTKTPWENNEGTIEARGTPICTLFQAEDFPCWDGPEGQLEAECEANAAFIVLSANAHDALLAACQMLLKACDDDDPLGGDTRCLDTAVELAAAAIALAQPATQENVT